MCVDPQGVSYFDVTRLDWVVGMGGVTPRVNQYHIAVGLADTARHNITAVKAYSNSASPPIRLEAFSTLSGGCMELPAVRSIAAAHNVSAAMVCLRWIVQQNMSAAVSSDEALYDREDLLAAGGDGLLALSAAEMAQLSALSDPSSAAARSSQLDDDTASPCSEAASESAPQGRGTLSFAAAVFGPGMLLQRDRPVAVWGSGSRRRDCYSAAPPSPFSRCFNSDGKGVSAK